MAQFCQFKGGGNINNGFFSKNLFFIKLILFQGNIEGFF